MVKNFLTILSLLIPIVAFAATNDFVANSNITVPGVTFGASTANMLILSGSTAESWIFSSGTFTVTNPGSAFQIGSSDSAVKSIQASQSGTAVVCSENTTPGTSAATLPTTAGTYTVSPSATTQCTDLCSAVSNATSLNSFPTCGAASCNAGYTLSGSGASATCRAIGGGGVIMPCGAGYTLSGNLGSLLCIPNAPASLSLAKASSTPAGSSLVSVLTVFTNNLSFGMTSADVRRLQTLLASDKAVYPEGIISGYYGLLTKKAVERFQINYGITTEGGVGYGNVGPKTRAKLQKVFGTEMSTDTTTSVKQSSTGELFSSNLMLGMNNSDVYKLQQLLATDIEIYPEGMVTGYYGPLTKKAVERFQLGHKVVSSPNDAGFGTVGPKTRAALQEVYNK